MTSRSKNTFENPLNSLFSIVSMITLTTLIVVIGGCAANDDSMANLTPPPPSAPVSETYSAASATSSRESDSRRLGRFFLVEQSSAQVSTSLLEAFRKDPPGGIVFWNFSKAGWQELAKTVSRYSQVLKTNGHLPALFSIDYEGGGLTLSPSGKKIPGIQRFRAGFTDLVHGAWLGRSLAKYDTELCGLHGRIMGKELASVGVNYPLTLVADLAQRLFVLRGVSSDPAEVSRCLARFTDEMAKAGPVIAVTKHYPGLGQNSGDTHDVVSISTARTMADSDRHLFPFRDLITYANRNALETRLSIMSSHGKFPLIDPKNLTTESQTLLEGVLRDQFSFQGIRVSDAMWMGGYGSLQGDALYAVYLNAFSSGLDLLMIPGNRYGGALRAFQQVADGTANSGLRNAIQNRSGLSFDQFQDRFNRRVYESLKRIDATLSSLPYPHETVTGTTPTSLTTVERTRYHQILRSLDSRWNDELPHDMTRP